MHCNFPVENHPVWFARLQGSFKVRGLEAPVSVCCNVVSVCRAILPKTPLDRFLPLIWRVKCVPFSGKRGHGGRVETSPDYGVPDPHSYSETAPGLCFRF